MLRAAHSLAAALALTAACGSSEGPASAPATAPVDPAAVNLVEAPQGRTVVAKVNGTPIYDDCVARQARAHDLEPRAALDECIDFELLAQTADARGLRVHPEVLDARATEAARALIGVDFERDFDGPEDIPAEDVRSAYEGLKAQRWVHPELRTMQYVRVPLGHNGHVSPFRSLAGLAALIGTYEQLGARSDITGEELHATAQRLAGDIRLEAARPLTFSMQSNIVPQFKKIVFEELRVPGTIAAPRRTRWGWDIILLVDVLPPINKTLAEVEDEVRDTIFKQARQRAFAKFLEKFTPAKPEISSYWLERLSRADRAQASLLEPSP